MTPRLAATVLLLVSTAACIPTAPSRDESVRDIEAASDRAAAKAREQVERGEVVDVTAETDAMRKTVDEAAAKATGDDAAVLRASSKVLELMQDSTASHQKALQSFLDGGSIDPAAMSSQAAVEAQLGRLGTFCQANDDMRRLIASMTDEFGRIALAEGASEGAAAAASRGFISTFPQASLLQLRKLDADFCSHARSTLGILSEQWGHWQADAAQGLVFDEAVPESTVARYNEAIQEIQRVGAQQVELQQKLIAK